MPSVRSAALGFFVATGSRGETPAEAGLSHFLEHLLFRGTERYASAQIDQLFDGMGAELNAGTDKESTAVYARMLDQHLPAAFDVMADMVWRPAFRDVDPEREVVLEEIAMYEDDPQDTVFDVLGDAVFGDHPLGRPIIGRAPVIRDTPVDSIAAFHARRYVPSSVVVAAAGSVDHDEVVALAERTLGGLRSGERAPAPEAAPALPHARVRFRHLRPVEREEAVAGATEEPPPAPEPRHEVVSPQARGGAINPEAKLLLLQNAFDARYHRVEFKTDARNSRSRAALVKLGAKEEGILRGHMWMPPGVLRDQGYFRDSVYFSILSPEWPLVRESLHKRLAAL